MVDYEALRQLVCFAECGTLSRVAESFHTSQPTVTRAMRQLEEDFGVPLFTRTKNSIALNENGRLAAREAAAAMHAMESMLETVRQFDRAARTIAIGSCIMLPIPEIIGRMSRAFPEMTISSEMKLPEELLPGLNRGLYQLIILPYIPENPLLASEKIGGEHLMFCLPRSHPKAGCSSLSLADMDGEAMLMLQNVGFWKEIVTRRMPHSRFILQSDAGSLFELIRNSALPCFTTDLSLRTYRNGDNAYRVNIPITDPEVNVSYYAVYRREDMQRFGGICSSGPILR